MINIITGNGHTAGDRMVKHPDVDKVAFTGSTEIGKLINRNATETLKHVTLELGGKSPVVVMPDVDVAETAPGVAGAIFFNSGQVCVAGSRLYAHKSVFDEVIEGMAATADFWAPRAIARSRPRTWARWSARSSTSACSATSRPASATAPAC